MNRDAISVQRRLDKAWNDIIHEMRRMSGHIDLRPSRQSPFRPVEAASPGSVKFDVGPIVFNVPENARARTPNLYITIEGWLSFEGPDFTNLRTKDFGTEIAYFRSRIGALQHVYGAHYDMDEARPGHPVFHMQVKPMVEFAGPVNDLFKLRAAGENAMGTILANVRTPSAQMDVFSVVTQICADHLIDKESPKEVRTAFKALRRHSTFFLGAAHRLAYLSEPQASGCYRSNHWYDAPVANI